MAGRYFFLLLLLICGIFNLVNSARPTATEPTEKPLIPLARALDGGEGGSASRPTVPRIGGRPASTTRTPTTPTSERTGCRRRVSSCLHLSNATCLGAALPYSHVSLDLAGKNREYEAVSALREWGVLRAAPECWSAVRTMLCAVMLAPCRVVPGSSGDSFEADLVPRRLCLAARKPCRIVEEQLGGWPDYLRCDNDDVFADRSWTAPCGVVAAAAAAANNKSITPTTRSNYTRGHCLEPLVPTLRETAYFGSFGGCGMRCLAPPYKDDDYKRVKQYSVAWGACVAVTAALVLCAHLWSRSPQSERRVWNATWANVYVCWLLLAIAISMRGLVGDSLVCHEDGARRADAGGLCLVNFFLVYVSFIAFLVWFVGVNYYWMVRILRFFFLLCTMHYVIVVKLNFELVL